MEEKKTIDKEFLRTHPYCVIRSYIQVYRIIDAVTFCGRYETSNVTLIEAKNKRGTSPSSKPTLDVNWELIKCQYIPHSYHVT